MDAQAVFDRAALHKVPDFGVSALNHGAQVISDALEAGERFGELVAEVRAELRSEMKKALGGELEFVPGFGIDVHQMHKEKLVTVFDAVMEALNHRANPAVLISMMTATGAHSVDLITLREGVIDAYVDLNAEGVAQARWERQQ